jgi:AcrR family transcriptional regulator
MVKTKKAGDAAVIQFSAPGGETHGPKYDERFARLLRTAARVIAEEGYEKASIRTMAAKTRMSIAGLYYYFKSKEEVLYLIQLNTFESLTRNLKERLSLEPGASPERRIRIVVANHLQHFLAHLPELKVCARELESLKGARYREVLERRREYYHLTREIIDELVAGSEQTVDTDLAALSLFGMLNWVYQWYNPRRHSDLEKLESQLSGIFLLGIKPRADASHINKDKT